MNDVVIPSMHDCTDPKCVFPTRHEGSCTKGGLVEIDYTNWKGDRRVRRVVPTKVISFERNDWHKEKQWLFGAIDREDGQHKLFAFSGLHSWKEVK